MRPRTYQHDDDTFDERGLLKDGKSFRTSLTMMDGVQKGVARSSVRVTDGAGGTRGLNRPGFRFAADAAAGLHARDAAQADYLRDLTTAWRGDVADARKVVRRDPRGRLEGTFEEQEDEEQERHGTERQTSDAMRARDAAHRDYERRLCDAYKTPTGFGGDPSITGFGERDNVGQRGGGTGMLDYEENAEHIAAATHTEAARSRDHRTVDQMVRDHQNKMADIYDNLDRELSETWRGP